MTAKEMAALIGRKGYARLAASGAGNVLRVDVEVIDAKQAFGRQDVLVTPVAGAGKAWMSLENVTLYEEKSS